MTQAGGLGTRKHRRSSGSPTGASYAWQPIGDVGSALDGVATTAIVSPWRPARRSPRGRRSRGDDHQPRQGLLPAGRPHQARPRPLLPRRRRRRAARRRRPADGAQALRRRRRGRVFFQKRAPENRPDWIETVRRCVPVRAHRRRGRPATTRPAWRGSSTSAASTSTRTRSAPTTSTTPTSCGSTSIPCPACAWSQIREVALVAREVLDDVGLVGWPKTSGSRGIHVNVRIEPRWTFPQVRRAALALARDVERRAPDDRHQQVVEGGAPRRLPRLQPEREGPHRRLGLLGPPDARRAGVDAARPGTRCPTCEPEDFTLATVPALFAERGDPGAGIDDAVGSLEALLELSARHEAEGLGDAPWPPHYRKQAGEPPRVQPSKPAPRRRRVRHARGRGRAREGTGGHGAPDGGLGARSASSAARRGSRVADAPTPTGAVARRSR